jgi:hypothetical protein
MKRTALLALVAALAATAVTASVGTAAPAPTAAAAAVRHFEGTVLSVNRGARTFRLRDAERGTVRVRVTGSTRFERLAGLRSLRRGLRGVEVTTSRRVRGAWVATLVERSGGGGRHGGGADDNGARHGGGADDGPNHL